MTYIARVFGCEPVSGVLVVLSSNQLNISGVGNGILLFKLCHAIQYYTFSYLICFTRMVTIK